MSFKLPNSAMTYIARIRKFEWGGIIEIEKTYRSLPLWLAREYLESIGGRVARDDLVQGDAWRAELHRAPDFEIGALRVGQIRVVFQADAETIFSVIAAFEKKAMRAGG